MSGGAERRRQESDFPSRDDSILMDETLAVRLGEPLAACHGVECVVLGGSHASGTADAQSDIDLGLYYKPEDPPDLESLRQLIAEIDDHGRRELSPTSGSGDRG